jgi:DNA modification methylase
VIYLADPDLVVFHGDALETLRRLPSESVHMCVTSPPFYGLRDYGTGIWEGGDEGCDHEPDADWMHSQFHAKSTLAGTGDSKTQSAAAKTRWYANDGSCPRCGARRIDQQIGLEATPDQWLQSLVAVFREVRRVLRADGTLWVEVGDSYANVAGSGRQGQTGVLAGGVDGYIRKLSNQQRGASAIPAGLKPKDLVGAPWLLAFALRADGWYLRSDIIWARPNPMPESVTDRPTKSHSYVFLLSKSARYFYDADAIREDATCTARPESSRWNGDAKHQRDGRQLGTTGLGKNDPSAGRNKRSVWTIATEPLPDEHYAAYPQALVEPCILAGTSERGVCPDCGAPWLRETETSYTEAGKGNANQARKGGDHIAAMASRPYETRMLKSVETLGWRPSCDHQHEPVPAVVLDPFLGSGTTALVARRLGRRCVGVELSASYCALIAKRTQQLSLLADNVPG